jgi:hypothetical protein
LAACLVGLGMLSAQAWAGSSTKQSKRPLAYLSAGDARILGWARYPVMLPPRIPSGWGPAVAALAQDGGGEDGAWSVALETNSTKGFAGGWVNGGPARYSQCSDLRVRYGVDPQFRCDALRARGVEVAEFPGVSGQRSDFFWVKCHTGFSIGVDAARSKPGAIPAVKALIDDLVPANVGPSAAGC